MSKFCPIWSHCLGNINGAGHFCQFALCPTNKGSETSGMYYKSFTIVIYNHNDSGQYHESMITIIIYHLTYG